MNTFSKHVLLTVQMIGLCTVLTCQHRGCPQATSHHLQASVELAAFFQFLRSRFSVLRRNATPMSHLKPVQTGGSS